MVESPWLRWRRPGMVQVEKLEKVLHTEDAARTTVADAQSEAAKVVSDARARAAELLRASREKTKMLAAERREGILAEARDAAASLSETGEKELAEAVAVAAERRDAALAAVLEELKGT